MEDYNENLLSPASEPDKVGQEVWSILEEILADKADLGLPDKWCRFYELARNKHWQRPSTATLPLLSGNLLFRHRLQTVNTLTDNNPTFNLSRTGSGEQTYDEALDKLHRLTEYWWNETEQQGAYADSVTNGETYGCAVEKVIFNPVLESGLGEVETICVDNFHFGVYPVKEKKTQKAEANFHFYPVSKRELQSTHPEVAQDIESDDEILENLGDERRDLAGGPDRDKTRSMGDRIRSVFAKYYSSSERSEDTKGHECLVCEAWAKDKTMIREKYFNEMTIGEDHPEFEMLQAEVVERPMYPGFIRKVKVCNMGQLMLEDVPNPNINPNLEPEQASLTYLYDRFPFTRVSSISDTSDPWGMCDFEQLEGLQMEFNKSLSQIILIKNKSARVKFINPEDSGVQNYEINNDLGVLNPSTSIAAQGLKYLDAPHIDQDLYQCVELLKGLFFLVAGSFELEGAQVQGGGSLAYKAIAALIEQVARLMRGKIRNYNLLIRERGRMATSHFMNWYTEPRWFSYEENGKEKADQVSYKDILIPARLTVVNGSTMPVSKVQQREEAIYLFDRGAFGEPGSASAAKQLLRALDWDGWAEVVKELEAGPFGELITRMEMVGFPEVITQAIDQIMQMDQKELEAAVKKGEVATFNDLFQSIQQQQPPQTHEERMLGLEEQEKQADIQASQADQQIKQIEVQSKQQESEVKMAEIQADAAVKQADAELKKAGAAERMAEAEKQMAQAEVERKKLEEIESVILLNAEKMLTEQKNREVKDTGMELDREMMRVRKLEAVTGVKTSVNKGFSSAQNPNGGPYSESGLTSNNKGVSE